jgi:hypothetical protein
MGNLCLEVVVKEERNRGHYITKNFVIFTGILERREQLYPGRYDGLGEGMHIHKRGVETFPKAVT